MSLTDDTLRTGHQSLARLYRPHKFADVIGQDVVVRILKNAFCSQRVPQAFILAGIHGTGKTTLARIIAQTLNCQKKDGSLSCGHCDDCTAMRQSRHPDILEIDAASHTGVDNIREIIESVQYRPVAAPFKVYIIDEVHMLSKSAFNALLKTLEEPPGHTVFVFATTEIERVPLTILSRCQRLDLRRVNADQLEKYLITIASKQKIDIQPPAARLLAKASAGSVRDALSLLEAAVLHAGDKPIDSNTVHTMLARPDENTLQNLFDNLITGQAKMTMETFDRLCQHGSDPLQILMGLLDITHRTTIDHSLEPSSKTKTGKPVAMLHRVWQILLQGITQARQAPDIRMAADMALMRAAFGAHLPSGPDLLQAWQRDFKGASTPANTAMPSTPTNTATPSTPTNTATPSTPANTAMTSTPANTAMTSTPANTAMTSTPTNTATPSTPTNTATPSTPTNTATPSPPTNIAMPSTPANTATPSTPTNTAMPSTPANTATPSTPANTAMPSTPTNTATPSPPTNIATPSTPTNTAMPSTAANTATPSTPTNTATPSPPTNIATPSTPTNTAMPSTPTKTATPSTPANTAMPSTPTNTAMPSTPTNTAMPSTPTNTATPSTPTNTATPSTPTNTAMPSTPTKTATPSTPANTAMPSTPANTATPSTPANTATPSTPANTAMPSTPANTATPSTPTNTATPSTPTNTAMPSTPTKTATNPAPSNQPADSQESSLSEQFQDAFPDATSR